MTTSLRQACDRCHSRKLRCPKTPDSSLCNRCIKAGVPCIFSPPTRALRPNQDHTALAWSSLLDFNEPLLDITTNDFNINPLETMTASDQPSTADSNVSRLTELLVSLDRLQHEFKPSIREHTPITELKKFLKSAEGKLDIESNLDSLLQLAYNMGGLYTQVLETLVSDTEKCDMAGCMHQVHLSLQTRTRSKINIPLANLLIACHLRFLDILDTLVDNGRLCSHVTALLPKEHEPRFDIPTIRIGSFVAPEASAASMTTSMIIELQSSLTTKGRDLAKMVLSTEDMSRQTKALGLQCEALVEHSAATLADLQALRDHLVSLNLIG